MGKNAHSKLSVAPVRWEAQGAFAELLANLLLAVEDNAQRGSGASGTVAVHGDSGW